MTQEFNRRRFVGAAASVAAVAAAGPLLSACGGGGRQNTGGNSKSGLKKALPAYVPRNAVKPDIAPVQGSEGAVTDPGFLRYPTERPETVDGVPGRGGKYTAVTPLWGTVPSPGNSFYEAMNKALGVELTMKPVLVRRQDQEGTVHADWFAYEPTA
ncbi:hypothetical protein [Streptomyces sp. SD31]|uniref:hypothetical protein n=1 Tax=Streptomyces sp. SD31 TaxID=3452208 RepID=UPI003F897745